MCSIPFKTPQRLVCNTHQFRHPSMFCSPLAVDLHSISKFDSRRRPNLPLVLCLEFRQGLAVHSRTTAIIMCLIRYHSLYKVLVGGCRFNPPCRTRSAIGASQNCNNTDTSLIREALLRVVLGMLTAHPDTSSPGTETLSHCEAHQGTRTAADDVSEATHREAMGKTRLMYLTF
jgi:hypothetical protein